MGFFAYKQIKKTDPRNQDNLNMEEATTAQDFIPFEDIKEGMVAMPNHRYRAYIECSSLNYHLRTNKEKDAVESSFQAFINSLSFPTSIFLQTRIIDNSKMLKATEKDAMETLEVFPQLAEYTNQYLSDMEHLNEKIQNNKQKKKYIIIPFDEAMNMGELDDDEKFDYVLKEVSTRVNMVADGLSAMGVKTRIMRTRDVAELIYSTYNRENYLHVDNIMEGHYLSLMTEGENRLDKMKDEERMDWILYRAQNSIQTDLYNENLSEPELARLQEALETIDSLRDRLGSYHKQKDDHEVAQGDFDNFETNFKKQHEKESGLHV